MKLEIEQVLKSTQELYAFMGDASATLDVHVEPPESAEFKEQQEVGIIVKLRRIVKFLFPMAELCGMLLCGTKIKFKVSKEL